MVGWKKPGAKSGRRAKKLILYFYTDYPHVSPVLSTDYSVAAFPGG